MPPCPHPVTTALPSYGEDVVNEFVACHCKTYDGPPLKITDKGARKNIPYIVTFVQAKIYIKIKYQAHFRKVYESIQNIRIQLHI